MRKLLQTIDARLILGENFFEPLIDSVPLYDIDKIPNFSSFVEDITPSHGAAIFWTSGSTGSPKAVLLPHRAITRLFGSSSPIPIGNGEGIPSIAAVGWDGFALEVWSQLLSGGKVLIHKDDFFLPHDLVKMIQRGATSAFMTAGLFDIFIAEEIDCFDGLKSLWVGGDKISPGSCQKFITRFPHTPLINIYGPVECGIFAASHVINIRDASSPMVPVGTPTPGTYVTIVRESTVMPRGTQGEIWVSGNALACKYVGNNSETDASFVSAPKGISGDLRDYAWYRTGDEGLISDEGLLYCTGRLDRQIKIGGVRVNPAEVEDAAIRAGCVHACVVPRLCEGEIVGTAMMVVVNGSVDEKDIRRRIGREIVSQAIPWPIQLVPELPINQNGKVDRLEVQKQLKNAEYGP